jgi:hypothetical protein
MNLHFYGAPKSCPEMSVFVRTHLAWASTACVRRCAQEAERVKADIAPGQGLDGRKGPAKALRLAPRDVQRARSLVVEAQ